ncbi:unnamed protein product [Amoebophrya sp. A25]|nr:unnamed protein product [Amoebophrya sp. A25]|eukprot:GSA25T00020869001.1
MSTSQEQDELPPSSSKKRALVPSIMCDASFSTTDLNRGLLSEPIVEIISPGQPPSHPSQQQPLQLVDARILTSLVAPRPGLLTVHQEQTAAGGDRGGGLLSIGGGGAPSSRNASTTSTSAVGAVGSSSRSRTSTSTSRTSSTTMTGRNTTEDTKNQEDWFCLRRSKPLPCLPEMPNFVCGGVIFLLVSLLALTFVLPIGIQIVVDHSTVDVISLGMLDPLPDSVRLQTRMRLTPAVKGCSASLDAFKMTMHLVEKNMIPPRPSTTTTRIKRGQALLPQQEVGNVDGVRTSTTTRGQGLLPQQADVGNAGVSRTTGDVRTSTTLGRNIVQRDGAGPRKHVDDVEEVEDGGGLGNRRDGEIHLHEHEEQQENKRVEKAPLADEIAPEEEEALNTFKKASEDHGTEIGSFEMHPLELDGNAVEIAVDKRLKILNAKNLVEMGNLLLQSKKFQIRVLGHTRLHKFGLSYSLTFDQTIEMEGLNNLEGVIQLKTFDLPGEAPDGKSILVDATADIENPTNYTLALGHEIKLATLYEGYSMATITLTDFVLKPGVTKTVKVKGLFFPENLTSAAGFLSQYMQGGDKLLYLQAKGLDINFKNYRTGDIFHVPWFTDLVKQMRSSTGMHPVDGRKFVRGVDISEIGFEVLAEDALSVWGNLDIDFRIPFARFKYAITELEAELKVGQRGIDSSIAKTPMMPVQYIPHPQDHSGTLRIKLTKSPVQLLNVSAFNDLLYDVYQSEAVFLQLSGTGSAVMSSVLSDAWYVPNIPLQVETSIKGWNRFKSGISVKGIDILPQGTTDRRVHIKATIELDNDTPLAAKLSYLPAYLIARHEAEQCRIGEDEDKHDSLVAVEGQEHQDEVCTSVAQDVSLGMVEAFDQSLPANSLAKLHGTIFSDKDSDGTWPHSETSRSRGRSRMGLPVLPEHVHEVTEPQQESSSYHTRGRGRSKSRSSTSRSSTSSTTVSITLPSSSMEENNYTSPSIVQDTLEQLLGKHLSNETVNAYAAAATDALWKNLSFLDPFTRKLNHVPVSIPGRSKNLITWVQAVLSADVLLLKLEALLTIENTFSAALLVKKAVGMVYVGDDQDLLFGSVNVTFPGDGWLIGAKSNSTSDTISGDILLTECVLHPLTCGAALEHLLGTTYARVQVHLVAQVESKFELAVNATERNVPLSLHKQGTADALRLLTRPPRTPRSKQNENISSKLHRPTPKKERTRELPAAAQELWI